MESLITTTQVRSQMSSHVKKTKAHVAMAIYSKVYCIVTTNPTKAALAVTRANSFGRVDDKTFKHIFVSLLDCDDKNL